MSDLGLGALSRDRLIARIEALEAEVAQVTADRDRIAEIYESEDKRVDVEMKAKAARIEALEAALRRFAEIAESCIHEKSTKHIGLAIRNALADVEGNTHA